MKRTMCVCLTIMIACSMSAWADDKADPVGTWKYTVTPPMGEKFEVTLKIKKEGDKLTGVVIRDLPEGKQETKIHDAKVKNGEITFHVHRERDGQKIEVHYKGKLTADTIKGKIEVKIGDQNLELDWEAKRVKDAK